MTTPRLRRAAIRTLRALAALLITVGVVLVYVTVFTRAGIWG